MKAVRLLPVVLLVAACDAPTSQTTTVTADPEKTVAFVDGRNCWQNRCLTFDRQNRSISIAGRHPVSVPRDIDVRHGAVSETEFARMLSTANLSASRGGVR